MNRYYSPITEDAVETAVFYSDAIKSKPDTLTALSSHDEILAAGFVAVEQPPYPQNGKNHKPGVPVLKEGKYVGVWVEQDTPDFELRKTIRERAARKDRDALLERSDWTQMPDAPLTEEQRESWKVYRQALRDVTLQPGFPWEINWPAV